MKKTTALAASLIGAASVFAIPAGIANASTAHVSAPLTCSAWASSSRPWDYTTEVVRVDTVKDAQVTATAHYRTVNRTHTERASRHGSASVYFYIDDATPGYRVKVSVTVRDGYRVGFCSTSFTPRH